MSLLPLCFVSVFMSIERFKKGSIKDLDKICRLYKKCKDDLLDKRILQWGDWNNNYPSNEYLRQATAQEELFVLTLDKGILGAVILNEKQSSKWKGMPWNKGSLAIKKKVLVIHALVIDPKNQGKGFGKKLLAYCEQYAYDNKYKCVRLDSFKENDMANKLYQGQGYTNIGTVIFDQKPEGNREYYCYEKVL